MKKLILIFTILITVGSVSAALVGSWNFNGNLNNDLGSKSALVLYGSSSISYTSDTIGTGTAQVLSYPAFPGGYTDYIGMPNDSGINACSNYTLVMDVKIPSPNSYSCLLDFKQNSSDGDFFVHNGGIGIHGQYDGTFNADTWYRIALAAYPNAANDNVILLKYIDGSLVGTQAEDIVRWSIYDEVRLFVDNDGETSAGLVNSLAFWNETLSDSAISGLGGPTANGIAVPEPASIILLLTALIGFAIRR